MRYTHNCQLSHTRRTHWQGQLSHTRGRAGKFVWWRKENSVRRLLSSCRLLWSWVRVATIVIVSMGYCCGGEWCSSIKVRVISRSVFQIHYGIWTFGGWQMSRLKVVYRHGQRANGLVRWIWEALYIDIFWRWEPLWASRVSIGEDSSTTVQACKGREREHSLNCWRQVRAQEAVFIRKPATMMTKLGSKTGGAELARLKSVPAGFTR